MRGRLSIVAGLGLLSAVLLARSRGSGSLEPADPSPKLTGVAATEPAAEQPSPVVTRDPFRYATLPGSAPASPPAAPTAAPTHATPAAEPPDPVRLVGLVRRGGTLRAALSFGGVVWLLAPGEEAEGYRLLSIDEETARLRGPGGAVLVLALAQ